MSPSSSASAFKSSTFASLSMEALLRRTSYYGYELRWEIIILLMQSKESYMSHTRIEVEDIKDVPPNHLIQNEQRNNQEEYEWSPLKLW